MMNRVQLVSAGSGSYAGLFVVAVVLEPAAIGIVPSEMGVDHVVGRGYRTGRGLLAAATINRSSRVPLPFAHQ